MRRYVVDASVVVKWLLPQREAEAHVEQALHLLQQLRAGELSLVQPPHWLAEVAAVLVRLRPQIAGRAVSLLAAMEIPVVSSLVVYQSACALSARLGHHLFDTLYHAVALAEPELMLVTADEAYFRKAADQGAIVRLADLPV